MTRNWCSVSPPASLHHTTWWSKVSLLQFCFWIPLKRIYQAYQLSDCISVLHCPFHSCLQVGKLTVSSVCSLVEHCQCYGKSLAQQHPPPSSLMTPSLSILWSCIRVAPAHIGKAPPDTGLAPHSRSGNDWLWRCLGTMVRRDYSTTTASLWYCRLLV